MAEHNHEHPALYRDLSEVPGWNDYKPLLAAARQPQDFDNYFWNIPGTIKALGPHEHKACTCGDCGTPGPFHWAGTGVTTLNTSLVAKNLLQQGVTEVTSHGGPCGAAAAYAKQQEELFKLEPGTLNPDEITRNFAMEVADIANLPHRHIEVHELKRPPKCQDAFGMIYDGTGNFDNTPVPGLPKTFGVTRTIGQKNSLAEVDFLLNIAMGYKGLNKLYTPTHPFIIIPIGNDELPVTMLERELQQFTKKYDGRVIVAGVDATKVAYAA